MLDVVSHMCYGRRMAAVASRELRNNTRAVLDRVESGESIVITVDGRPVATLEPIPHGRRTMPRAEFLQRLERTQPDPSFADDLRRLAPDTTDDLPWG
jgi:prevent-host-death family protein